MPVIPNDDRVEVYQFRNYSIELDDFKVSARWGARAKIKDMFPNAEVFGPAKLVPSKYLRDPETDIEGLTRPHFDPDNHGPVEL